MSIRMLRYHNTQEHTINRKTYRCVRIKPCFASNQAEWDFVRQEAVKLVEKTNPTEANNGAARNQITRYKDALAGVIAEVLSMRFLNYALGNGFIERPQADSAINQIDLKTKTGQTIEVRSSFVRNGIPFALFAANPKTKSQYFDIIGPYHNAEYKRQNEICKDYFLRVLYLGDKKDFSEKAVLSPDFTVYIAGGANRAMMQDTSICYTKQMLAPQENGKTEKGEYSAVPIGKALDAADFVCDISKTAETKTTEQYHILESKILEIKED